MLLLCCPLPFDALLALLGAQRFDTLSHVLVCIEIAFGHACCLRHRIEIYGVLLSEELINRLVDTLLCLL